MNKKPIVFLLNPSYYVLFSVSCVYESFFLIPEKYTIFLSAHSFEAALLLGANVMILLFVLLCLSLRLVLSEETLLLKMAGLTFSKSPVHSIESISPMVFYTLVIRDDGFGVKTLFYPKVLHRKKFRECLLNINGRIAFQ